MKNALPLLLLLAHTASAGTAPEWITETPLEFITTGRFQTPSDGTDLLVVDKATGLARIGLKVGASLQWSEQSTGIATISALTTLRHGAQDQIAASSATWNAVQLVSAGGTPQTLTSPLVGPHGLVRLSTGHAAGAVVDDILTLGSLGSAPDPNEVAALTDAGTALFTTPVIDLPADAQFIPLSPAPGLPVLVSRRGNTLRIDRMNRSGFIGGGFDVTGPHPAGIHWTAAAGEIFSTAKGSLTLEQHRIASGPGAPGFTLPTNVAQTTPFTMPEAAISVDAVPFSDPAYPALSCLVAVRFTSAPDEVHLYRLLDAPTPSAAELMTLTIPPGEDFAGLVAVGEEFQLLSGPGGRVKTWQRYAQPGPGQLPVVVDSGTLPTLRARAANPNIFIFDQDPFITGNAILIASQSRLDWTTLTTVLSQGESDGGAISGLGSAQSITVSAPGGVAVGNQILPSASLAGFGPAAALVRGGVTLSPAPGAYAALAPDQKFQIHLIPATPGDPIHYHLSSTGLWALYDDAAPPSFTANGCVSAFSTGAGGSRSPIVSGTYTFADLPPTVPAASIDADSNGLSDAWERAFGITDPNRDDDGDGFNALTEQNYGSDPLDAGSRPPGGSTPAVTLDGTSLQPGSITLAWPDGLVGYILEYSTNFVTWYPVSPQPLDNRWSEPITGGQRFYRLSKQ